MPVRVQTFVATSTICPSWKHHFVWSGVKRGEKFLNQPGFDTPCFARSNEVTNDRFQPCVLADAKNHAWMLVHLQFVHWRAGEQVAISFYAFDHFPAQFFLGDFLHRLRDEFEVGVVTDLELHLVPDVWKKWPRIIVNEFVEHFFVWELIRRPLG